MNSNVKYKVLVLTVNTFKIYIGHLYVDFQVTYLFCTSMSLKKTLFNEDWLKDSQFSSWIARSIHKDKARCKLCATDFQLGNMGKQALLSHARGKKHQKIIAVKVESQKAGTGLHNFLVPRSPKENRSVDIQETSTRNTDSPECSNSSPCSENLTVPPPPREPQETSLRLAKFQAISQRKMCYQHKSCGP